MSQSAGWVLWLTGLPASGKTTVAQALQHKLSTHGVDAVVLDSDMLRSRLTPEATYLPEERDRFYAQLVEHAVRLAGQGHNVIIAATGHRQRYRSHARSIVVAFAEIWVRCPLDVCRSRDPKGLYTRAVAGEVTNLPGVGAPYEPPSAPEVIVDTDRQTPEEAADRIIVGVPFVLTQETRTHNSGE